jgi:hypothetical protein
MKYNMRADAQVLKRFKEETAATKMLHVAKAFWDTRDGKAWLTLAYEFRNSPAYIGKANFYDTLINSVSFRRFLCSLFSK